MQMRHWNGFWPAKHAGRQGDQGCQMVGFQIKNPNLGKFWSFLQWKMFCYILWILGPFYSLLLYFMDIWYNLW
jgi:hypothetical protein